MGKIVLEVAEITKVQQSELRACDLELRRVLLQCELLPQSIPMLKLQLSLCGIEHQGNLARVGYDEVADEFGNVGAVGRDNDSEVRVSTDSHECLDQLSQGFVEQTHPSEPEVSREVLEDAQHHILIPSQ